MNKYYQRCKAAQYNLEKCKEYFRNVQKSIIDTDLVYMKRVAINGVPSLMEVSFKKLQSRAIKQNTLDGNVITMDYMPDYYMYKERIKQHEDAIKEILKEAKNHYRYRFDAMKEHHLGECYRERLDAYNEYLKSQEWQEKRQECLKYHGHNCADCGMHGSLLECHHLHYETLGDENPETDLIPLCKQCHEARHK